MTSDLLGLGLNKKVLGRGSHPQSEGNCAVRAGILWGLRVRKGRIDDAPFNSQSVRPVREEVELVQPKTVSLSPPPAPAPPSCTPSPDLSSWCVALTSQAL